jgi:hypothetical protein
MRCGQGFHRPDSVGYCRDCGNDCTPELRGSIQFYFERAVAIEAKIEMLRTQEKKLRTQEKPPKMEWAVKKGSDYLAYEGHVRADDKWRISQVYAARFTRDAALRAAVTRDARIVRLKKGREVP